MIFGASLGKRTPIWVASSKHLPEYFYLNARGWTPMKTGGRMMPGLKERASKRPAARWERCGKNLFVWNVTNTWQSDCEFIFFVSACHVCTAVL